MLDEVIRELTVKDNNEQTTSKDVLVWAKRIEVQWAQAAILNITKSQKFNKVKMAQRPKTKWDVKKQHTQCITNGHANIVVEVMHPGSAQHMENVHQLWENGPLQGGMHEVEIEMAQELQEEGIETVSINSIYLNKN